MCKKWCSWFPECLHVALCHLFRGKSLQTEMCSTKQIVCSKWCHPSRSELTRCQNNRSVVFGDEDRIADVIYLSQSRATTTNLKVGIEWDVQLFYVRCSLRQPEWTQPNTMLFMVTMVTMWNIHIPRYSRHQPAEFLRTETQRIKADQQFITNQ